VTLHRSCHASPEYHDCGIYFARSGEEEERREADRVQSDIAAARNLFLVCLGLLLLSNALQFGLSLYVPALFGIVAGNACMGLTASSLGFALACMGSASTKRCLLCFLGCAILGSLCGIVFALRAGSAPAAGAAASLTLSCVAMLGQMTFSRRVRWFLEAQRGGGR